LLRFTAYGLYFFYAESNNFNELEIWISSEDENQLRRLIHFNLSVPACRGITESDAGLVLASRSDVSGEVLTKTETESDTGFV
jgi:hypothetical protein